VSYDPIPDTNLAAVVTYLEMTAPPDGDRPSRARDCPLSLERVRDPDPDEYRLLFRRVGSRWLWFSRLVMSDDELGSIIADPHVALYKVVSGHAGEVGMLELDFRAAGECELAFVGLVPELSGKGHGRWLLSRALELAWREGVARVHVHTCSLDHPAALRAYEKAGFRAYRRAIERFADPRLRGILPVDCAPQVPLLGTDTLPPPPPDSCA
jgi:GNAT superfamily N-acetyltransferase